MFDAFDRLYYNKSIDLSFRTVLLIVAFSQYSKNISVPCLMFERGKGFRKTHFPLFRLFPVSTKYKEMNTFHLTHPP